MLAALAHFEPWTRVPAALQLLSAHALDRRLADTELAALQAALQRSRYAPTPEQTWAVLQAARQLRELRPDLVLAWP